MSPNSENAMARFLFAILKQKSLKDIDWNEVANDPVLLEPITNGHAARMRFSRFKATVTGRDPAQARVAHRRAGRNARARRAAVHREAADGSRRPSYADLEQMMPHPYMMNGFSPAASANNSPYLADNLDDFNTGVGLMTPASDDIALPIRGVVNPQALDNRNNIMACPGGVMTPAQARAHGSVAPAMISPPMDFVSDANATAGSPFSAFEDSAFDMADFTFEPQSDGAVDPNYPLF